MANNSITSANIGTRLNLNKFIIHSDNPFNAEPKMKELRKDEITKTEHFFVRCNGNVPVLSENSFKLYINGQIKHPLTLTLDDIKNRYEKIEIIATLQCAGNRRAELAAYEPIPNEVQWQKQAVGNAIWGGARLRDILTSAELIEPPPDIQYYVAFESCDSTEKAAGKPFGGSIELQKALSPEVILAYEMNGAPLTPEHGYPLRVVVPGYIGARSVKWLASITVQDQPSQNYFQRNAYKMFTKEFKDPKKLDWSKGLTLTRSIVSSVIISPLDNDELSLGDNIIRGIAYSGGSSIKKVELSIDNGQSWYSTELKGSRSPWSWQFFERKLYLPVGCITVISKATDTNYDTQPDDVSSTWNIKGYMNNAQFKVIVNVSSEKNGKSKL